MKCANVDPVSSFKPIIERDIDASVKKVALTGKKGSLSKEEKRTRANTLAKASRKRKMDSRTEEEAVEFRDHQNTLHNESRKLRKDSMTEEEAVEFRDRTNQMKRGNRAKKQT